MTLHKRSAVVLAIACFLPASYVSASETTNDAASIKTSTAQPASQSATKPSLQRGQLVYQRFCARCHGKNLEGQPNWKKRKADGKLPAPPQDGSGHTWHHADELLFGIIKFGLVPPYGPENYKTDMPAWGSTLSDDDIRAVLTFIKNQWPLQAQEIQAEMGKPSFR
jgi:mono/diheme cytochrome c family protein